MSRSGKLGSCFGIALLLIFTFLSMSCGSSGGSAPPPPPITVTITPNPTASMNLGSVLQFSASVTQNKTVLTATVKFHSGNTAILNFSPSGLACAGSWDRFYVVCSPGTSGVVDVVATSSGTRSATTKVYVHPQVTSIQSEAINPPAGGCVSQAGTENFQATVYNGSTDITPLVGPLVWIAIDAGVAKLNTTGLQPNQVQATASQPGATQIFASISGVNGQPAPFETCPVQSISVSAAGSDFLQLAKGSSSSLSASVTDSQGKGISAAMTWVSSHPGVATTKNGSVTAVSPGGTDIFPICSPPGCNVNLYSIYPKNVVHVTVTGSAVAQTVYVTSTGCVGVANCKVSLIPIDTQTNAAGTAISLPAPPNSFLIDSTGTNAYLGTAGGLRSMVIASSAFKTAAPVTGKVLAVSPDGILVLVSNTSSNPNVVNVVNTKDNTSTQLLLSGVTAGVFSPDSTKAYLLAGNSVYVYSTTVPVQTISLSGVTDAGFSTTGMFGFVAGTPSTVSLFNGCDNAAPQSPNTSTVSTISQASLLAPLPGGQSMAAVNSPGFTSIAINSTAAGCPPPVTATSTFHDFGQGSFTPKQVLVSSDGARLYVLSDQGAVLVYDFSSDSSTVIPLNPSATPLSAALTLDGADLYVGASDGTVHHLDTAALTDRGQIKVAPCSVSSSCLPDLVVLRP